MVEKFIIDIKKQTPQAASISLRVILQTAEEMKKGWQGEEFIIDQTTVGEIMVMGLDKYFEENLQNKMKRALKNPVFCSDASFEVFYEPRAIPVLKLVIDNPIGSDDFSQGIDLV